MSWGAKPETFLQETARHFYEDEKYFNEQDKFYLEMAVAYYNIWNFLILNCWDSQFIENQEYFITEEVKHQWGPCDFTINRETQTFHVLARDGRTMDLRTGEPL